METVSLDVQHVALDPDTPQQQVWSIGRFGAYLEELLGRAQGLRPTLDLTRPGTNRLPPDSLPILFHPSVFHPSAWKTGSRKLSLVVVRRPYRARRKFATTTCP